MVTRRHTYKSAPSQVLPSIIRLWLLRLLVPLGGQRVFITPNGFHNDILADVLGLGAWLEASNGDFDANAVKSELRLLHQEAEIKMRGAHTPLHLKENVDRLASLVGLSNIDCRILEFAVVIHSERLLDDTADWLGQLSSMKAFHALAVLLNLSEEAIKVSLSMQGLLAKSGLVSVDRRGLSSLSGKLNLLSDNFADSINCPDADPVSLIRDMVSLGSPPQLSISDYDHIGPSLSLLRPYLKNAVATGRKGVNIFLHGSPGTGKTQLAKVLAKELCCDLFEVTSEDADGDPVKGERRLRAFRAAQSFFVERHALIVFDEAEDVFNNGEDFFARMSAAQTRKAWINRILEENAVPTLWLSNTIDGLDPAFVRRFDMIFEVPVPSKLQRERIIQNTCADLLGISDVKLIAESEDLSPAVVARAASVVRSIREELGDVSISSAFNVLIGNTLEAQKHQRIKKNDPHRLPELYDPAYTHTDTDLLQLAAGLLEARSGRLCLFGPPGTGKTAYGRWLARYLDMPLLVKRASDLMSKWVGGNEKNISNAFKEAEQDNALLLIDEIDGFLQDRRGAQRSWEVTLVNEMLTQMEAFPGIFIASTNLMDGLDQAAQRRFDLKVKFDFLMPEQAYGLFCRYCTHLQLDSSAQEHRTRLMRLQQLTPGDFAAVIRQHRFRPMPGPDAFVDVLEAECAMKESPKRVMGFH